MKLKPLLVLTAGCLLSLAVSSQIKVACIGNSITYGVGYDRAQSYPGQLNTILGSNWEVRNFGVPGATLLRNGDMPYYKLGAYADAQAFNPDVVIIKLGTNDTKPQNWQFKDEFEKDYTTLITELKALPSKPFIILCTPVPAYSFGWGIRDSVLKVEIPILDKLAEDNKLKLINLYQPLSNHADWFPDGIHPDEAGYKEIATVVSVALLKYQKEIENRLKGIQPGKESKKPAVQRAF